MATLHQWWHKTWRFLAENDPTLPFVVPPVVVQQYWKLRHMLTGIAIQTKEPAETAVEKGASKYGVQYKQLNYSDVAIGMRYFKRLGKQFGVKATPTIVIINRETKKGSRAEICYSIELLENNEY